LGENGISAIHICTVFSASARPTEMGHSCEVQGHVFVASVVAHDWTGVIGRSAAVHTDPASVRPTRRRTIWSIWLLTGGGECYGVTSACVSIVSDIISGQIGGCCV
jgi:hypothetical protein